jgi:hypothetical protein
MQIFTGESWRTFLRVRRARRTRLLLSDGRCGLHLAFCILTGENCNMIGARPWKLRESSELRGLVTATRSGRLPARPALAIHPRRRASCRQSKRAHQGAAYLRSQRGSMRWPAAPAHTTILCRSARKVPWQCSRLAPRCLAHLCRAGPGRSMMMSTTSVDGTSNMDASESRRTGIRAFRQCEIQAPSGPAPFQQ